MMRISLIALSTLIVFTSSTSNQKVTIIGPRTVTKNSNFKAFVNAEGLKADDALIIGLKSRNDVNLKSFRGRTTINQQIEYEMPVDLQDSYKLMSMVVSKHAKGKKICHIREQKIFASTSKNFFNLIQLDKSVYKPGDEVRFRILTLDHETKPYKYQTIKIDVLEPNGKVFKSFNEHRESDFSFVKDSFTLFNPSENGNWQIQVTVDGNTKSTKTFSVKDYKPPPFDVYIETARAVAFLDPSNFNPDIKLKIFAKYPINTFVKGTANINATVYSKQNPELILVNVIRQVQIEGGGTVISFDLSKDLNIKHLVKTAIVQFDVEFVEESKGRRASQSQRVEVLAQGRNYIKLKKAEKFKPGFDYRINLEILTLDGTPEIRTSIPIKMEAVYNYKNKRLSSEFVRQDSFPSKGKASFVLKPQEDVQNLNITFVYEGVKLQEMIEADRQGLEGDPAIEVTYEPENPKVGDKVNIKVQSNGLMDTLHLIVIGRNGLIKSQSFDDAKDNVDFELKLEVTKDMTPEFSVILFYTKENDGELVYDQFKLELGFQNSNHFKVSPSPLVLKPKEEVLLTLETKPNSLVGLLATDQSVKNHNDITNEVNSKLSSLGKLKSDSFEGNIYVDLLQSNVFVLQPLKAMKKLCMEAEQRYINRPDGVLPLASLADEFYDEETSEWEDPKANEVDDQSLTKYFPDVWLFDNIEVQRQSTSITKIVPDSISNWIIGGFSINPQHGLAVAEPQTIKVFKEFFIKTELPNSVKIGEVFKVDVTVFNYLKNAKTVDVSLKSGEFETLSAKQKYGSPAGCMEYIKVNDAAKRIEVPSNSGSPTEFFLRAKKSGTFKIVVEVKGQKVQDLYEKNIKVEYEGDTELKSYPMLIDLREKRQQNENIAIQIPVGVDPNTIKIGATISGNLLGPVMENVEKLIPEGNNEAKLKSFAISTYFYKYLESIGQTNTPLGEKAISLMRQGYQNVVRMQTANGGFKLWNNDENSEGIWFSAYVTQLLGDALNFIEIDQQLYTNALEYLKTKQGADKLYAEDGKSPKETPSRPNIYTTAFVMIAIAKNQKDYDTYAYLNTDAYYKLDGTPLLNDFEKAILAYAYALSDEGDSANEILDKLGWNFERLPTDQIKAMQVQIASYITLAALKLKRFNDAMRAVEWLVKQRRQDGGFFSTYDTVLGLEALAAYQMQLGPQTLSINFNFGQIFERINSETDSKSIELPPATNYSTVTASGQGLVYVNVFYKYKIKKGQEKQFRLALDKVDNTEKGIRINFRVASQKTSTMTIVEVEMPSGYEYINGPSSDQVRKIEQSDDKSKVFLYFDSISLTTYNTLLSIEASKIVDVEESKSAMIRVYDYYEPDQLNARIFYEGRKELNYFVQPAQKPTAQPSQTQPPLADPNLNNVQNQHPDVFYTAEVSEYITQRGAWDPWKQKYKYQGSWKKICDVAIVSENKVITGPWGKCTVKNEDLRSVRVRVKSWNENNQYRIDEYQVQGVSYTNSMQYLLITLASNIIDFNAVELAESSFSFENLNCITSSNLGKENEIKTKRFTLGPQKNCGYEKICSYEKIDNSLGNPLICNYNGRDYLFGIGIGVQQNVAMYQDVRRFKNAL